jgi:hypothetical protein
MGHNRNVYNKNCGNAFTDLKLTYMSWKINVSNQQPNP